MKHKKKAKKHSGQGRNKHVYELPIAEGDSRPKAARGPRSPRKTCKRFKRKS